MSIFDIDDVNIITPINLIEDGWSQSWMNEHVFLKWVPVTFKNGISNYVKFLYSFKSKEIVSTEDGMIRFTTKMDSLNEFIDKQLEQLYKKYEK